MILKGKTALITGATGAIGKAIAKAYLAEGCRVLLVGRDLEKLNQVAAELNSPDIQVYNADVSNYGSVQNLMSFAQHLYGSLNILVTAAGIYGAIGSVEECNPLEWAETFKTNIIGTMYTVKYALPLLRTNPNSKIITFAGGGEGPLPNLTAYASSKGAVLRFTESLAAELTATGICVNAISPGLVVSGLTDQLIKAGPAKVGEKKYQEALKQKQGESEAVSPDYAARLAVFLASDQSAGLTGKNISAVWDKYEDIPKHLEQLKNSDVYNWRRIKPKDRGYEW